MLNGCSACQPYPVHMLQDTEFTNLFIGFLKLVVEAVGSIPSNDQELLKDIIEYCATNIQHIFRPASNTFDTTLEWDGIFEEYAEFTKRLLQAVTARLFNEGRAHEDSIRSLAAENDAEKQSLLKRISDLEHELQLSQDAEDLYRRVYMESVERKYGSIRTPVLPRPDDTYS